MQAAERTEPPVVSKDPVAPGADGLANGTHSDATLAVVGQGTPEATAISQAEVKTAHHETLLGLDGFGWVGLAFLVFAVILLRLRVPSAIGGALDARAARVRSELDEARRLRTEAEALQAEYAAKLAQAEADAQRIREAAHTEAGRIAEKAHADAEARIVRRSAQAEDRIAAAARSAEAELRARAATLATQAAARVIGEHGDAAMKTALASRAIEEVGGRL
jgi:F-type H+-transporting ATPase subunit b